MSISKESFKALGLPYFAEVFAMIDEVMISQNTPYYLIGATAISLKLLQEGFRPSRGTKDIDFAIMVSSLEKYDTIKNELKKRGFNEVESKITLYHPGYNTVIDLLPFGELEQKDKQQFHEREIDLVVLGYKETLAHTEKIRITETHVANIPPLPAILMLKLISWNDRPENRSQDLDDIYKIVSTFFDLSIHEIYDHHTDLLAIDPFNEQLIAARLIGRKIAKYIHGAEDVKNRIFEILNHQITSTNDREIAIQWASKYNLTIDGAKQILSELKNGMSERL